MLATDITCVSCSTSFSFTQEEQEFYESKGFQPPKKCKPCRDAAKQGRNSGGGASADYGDRGSRPPRTMYDVVCASCGIDTQVPFQPTQDKSVYCRECFQNRAS